MDKTYKLIIFLAIFVLLVAGCSNQRNDETRPIIRPAVQQQAPTEEVTNSYVVEEKEIAAEPVVLEEKPTEVSETVEVPTESDVPATTTAELNSNHPEKTTRLIFLHHSTGENWLRDDYGELGKTLNINNYFVSDTNYGWGPDAIGDRTDIINWREWFRSENTAKIMSAVFEESEQHSDYTRTIHNPGGENEIIMFKSCFPNSEIKGHPDDVAADEGDDLTVANAKYIYNDLLKYFKAHPDKFFVIITAPPLQDDTFADNARAFNDWLVDDYLKRYEGKNVVVFDFYNILTGPENHHRILDGKVQHATAGRSNTAYYPSEDDHPSVEGSKKATEDFVPWLNVMVNCWKGDGACP